VLQSCLIAVGAAASPEQLTAGRDGMQVRCRTAAGWPYFFTGNLIEQMSVCGLRVTG
jgi:hypothetical protein